MSIFSKYAKWLHLQWPAGAVEKLPRVNSDGSTNVPGLYVVGDLTGIPLLKFSSDTGARVIQSICRDADFQKLKEVGGENIFDVVIVGAGVSGMAAALEAKANNLSYILIEASEPFSTIANFPKAKPIYTYPTEMVPLGSLQFSASVKEPLLEELKQLTIGDGIVIRKARVETLLRKGNYLEAVLDSKEVVAARRAVVAIGRSGNFRKLGVPGEELDKVYNRLHDPKDFAAKNVLVVGGGDSAIETAVALAQCGARVTLSYRKKEFARPKPDNVERLNQLIADPNADVAILTPVSERVTTSSGGFLGEHKKAGSIRLLLGSTLRKVSHDRVEIQLSDGKLEEIENDVVFSMIGREAPLDFFRRCGVKIRGETVGIEWIGILLFFAAAWFVYDWKGDGFLTKSFSVFSDSTTFPNNIPALISSWGESWRSSVSDRSTILGTFAISMKSRSFYYTLAYTLAIFWFGCVRISRRKTQYVFWQTSVLFLFQLLPLFLLPEFFLPWMGYNGFFDSGIGRTFADSLFEPYISNSDLISHTWPDWGHPRAYWRAYGFILAWPLMVYNVFTEQPMWTWLAISFFQTFVIIPWLVLRYGKGAYCGWICSCGGLAETMGDNHRHKMFHGEKSNRLNLLGQVILALAFILLLSRIYGWLFPEAWVAKNFSLLLDGKNQASKLVNPFSYKWVVDVFMGGVIGVGLYFKYSGRIWCRFACPLAALMHIYSRFSSFRIIVDKKKCISCNQCTSVCHMGIDIMNFANKGLHMNDPQCVRCSACVQSCPTGVLQFGRIDRKSSEIVALDRLSASRVER